MPSRSAIYRTLLRHRLLDPTKRRKRRSDYKHWERGKAMELWHLGQGNVDCGYAMTGHKAQGVTTSRTSTVITGPTDREWAYVTLSRGRQANTLYLAAPHPTKKSAPTHQPRRHRLDQIGSALRRSSAQIAALDHTPESTLAGYPRRLDPPPPNSDVEARVSWLVAQRVAKRQPQQPGIGLTAHR